MPTTFKNRVFFQYPVGTAIWIVVNHGLVSCAFKTRKPCVKFMTGNAALFLATVDAKGDFVVS